MYAHIQTRTLWATHTAESIWYHLISALSPLSLSTGTVQNGGKKLSFLKILLMFDVNEPQSFTNLSGCS